MRGNDYQKKFILRNPDFTRHSFLLTCFLFGPILLFGFKCWLSSKNLFECGYFYVIISFLILLPLSTLIFFTPHTEYLTLNEKSMELKSVSIIATKVSQVEFRYIRDLTLQKERVYISKVNPYSLRITAFKGLKRTSGITLYSNFNPEAFSSVCKEINKRILDQTLLYTSILEFNMCAGDFFGKPKEEVTKWLKQNLGVK